MEFSKPVTVYDTTGRPALELVTEEGTTTIRSLRPHFAAPMFVFADALREAVEESTR